MDFRNVNSLNVRMNYITGNLLPLTPSVSRYSIAWRLYASLMWLIQIAQLSILIPGFFLVSREKAVGEGTLIFVLTIEVFFIAGQIQTRRKLVNRFIQELNDILRIEDEIMKEIVATTIKPMNIPLRYYSVVGSFCVFVWFLLPFLIIFEKRNFFYEDFKMPAAFSNQPFSTQTFVLGSSLILIGNIHIFLKKCGLYVYIIHIMLMITAQYRYIAKNLATIFRNADKRHELGEAYKTEQWTENALKTLCRRHTIVTRLSIILRGILSSSLNMLYINSVLRFCFTAVLFTTVLSASFIEVLLVTVYSSGSIIEFYMLCSCVQQLQDASTEITDEAFHEKWYRFGPSIRRTFMLMILANKLGCKLSTCEKFSLSLSSFMTILNQSYSIALVLL
ncbi:uncharacterized protein LOC116842245 [Odontomachus brunneus]|uniref:uncharacterized protein LOC116842245 n=1 Tax=Odontomachus brunneus TaxID=486640 RepID=UPI0013F270F0|nr:uncharacterized protein LOC116842245 [Odontomachus brunneus]